MLSRTCARASASATRGLHRVVPPSARRLSHRPIVNQPRALRPTGPISGRQGVWRTLATGRSSADEIIEAITEQYATTKDEFEIAVEETEKNTLYAAEDRAAAAEEMAKLREMYDAAVAHNTEAVAADIRRRIGQRIRELDEAIKGLEESATQQD